MSIRPTASSILSLARALLFLLAIVFAGLVIFRYYNGATSDYTSVPEEYTLNYVNSDFRFSVDEGDALAIMSNPRRYKKEYDKLIYNLNLSILEHVANRMNLTEADQVRLKGEYKDYHPYLRNLYYRDFLKMRDSTSAMYQTWYDNESTSAVDVLHQIASKYTCFFVNQILNDIIETDKGKFYAKGRKINTPCGIAMTEALRPFMKRMEDRAAIADFGRSRGLFQERVEKVIAEMATLEVTDKKGINKRLQTKIGGFGISTSDLDITAISVLKVGFRLQDFFEMDLDPRRNVVNITLPEPQVLSHEVYPRVDRLSIGWLRELKDDNFNATFNLLREEFRKEAMQDKVMDKAKEQAEVLMRTMFEPAVKSLNNQYKIRVSFRPYADLDVEQGVSFGN